VAKVQEPRQGGGVLIAEDAPAVPTGWGLLQHHRGLSDFRYGLYAP
jgi:hypothetical protein